MEYKAAVCRLPQGCCGLIRYLGQGLPIHIWFIIVQTRFVCLLCSKNGNHVGYEQYSLKPAHPSKYSDLSWLKLSIFMKIEMKIQIV